MNTLVKSILATFMLGIVSLPGYADTVTTTTTRTVTIIRSDAPIYMGPVQDVTTLERLTLEDFQRFGTKPSAAFDQFQEYKQALENTDPNAEPVIYKMKIVDRELTLADFQGTGVSPELAQARYQEYVRTNPIPMDGKNVRYVYVYHSPIN